MSKSAKRHLTNRDLERLRLALVHKRSELLGHRYDSEHELRDVERESEPGDAAEVLIEQEAALRLAAFDAPVLADVEHALARLDDGTYGFSEESGEPIPLRRLEAVPWARRTASEESDRRRG
jgi:DnaK suppressor protein